MKFTVKELKNGNYAIVSDFNRNIWKSNSYACNNHKQEAALFASSPEMFGLLQDIELALKIGNLKKPNQWRDRISAIIRKIQEAQS